MRAAGPTAAGPPAAVPTAPGGTAPGGTAPVPTAPVPTAPVPTAICVPSSGAGWPSSSRKKAFQSGPRALLSSFQAR
ncbi:MAG TPA: hypothetical protein ENI27_10440 [bacterium]|nr:hypothetical protein [bacterium]